MTPVEIISLLALPALLFASAGCSGIETALFSLTHPDKLLLKRIDPRAASAVTQLLHSPRAFLITVLLGNVAVNTLYFALSVQLGNALGTGVLAATVGIASLLMLILVGELLPKSLAAAHRVAIARLFAIPTLWLFRAIGPLRFFLDVLIIAPAARALRPAGSKEVSGVSAEELGQMLKVAGSQGVLHRTEEQLLADVLRLRVIRVREIMIPRVSIDWMTAQSTVQDVLEKTRRTSRMKFPVFEDSIDGDVCGLIRLQPLLQQLQRKTTQANHAIRGMLEPPLYVPERAKLDQLLESFRTHESDLALCVDEHGSVTGLVTLEDVIEELITTSTQEGILPDSMLRPLAPGVFEAPGRLSIRDWAAFFSPSEVELDTRVSTIGGVILSKLGRLATSGDAVTIGNVELKVLSMAGRSIDKVQVSVLTGAAAREEGR